MATTYKVLAQNVLTTGGTAIDLYTVPAATSTVISTAVIANLTTSATTFRIAIRPAGATLANKHYIAYDVAISANDSTALTLGLTLATTDVVTVNSGTNTVAFSLYGSEIA